MMVQDLIECSQWLFLIYFIGLHLGYLLLNIASIFSISRYMQYHGGNHLAHFYSGFEPPISVLAPAYNEEATIVASIHSLLQLNYPEYEIIVINDGSSDRTLAELIRAFSLRHFPEAYRMRLRTEPIRAVYRSTTHPNLRVIDKANGGKADALNAGINCARYPLFCGMDADSILQRDSLYRIAQPFIEDSTTVASGGVVRIANGCQVRDGFLVKVGLPRNLLALLQIVEYLRAFLFGRMGWSPFNAVLIISGAFGLFHKDTVISVGGYRTDTVGEDMELVIRLHRQLSQRGQPYRIRFVPDPICWTEVPEDLKTLKSQRIRWQRGLSESLTLNMELLFSRRGGAAGWLAFPFMLIFEFLGPLIEVAGYVITVSAYWLGLIAYKELLAFLMLAIGFGLLLSAVALLLEEISYHLYPRLVHILLLFLVLLVENLGFRQLNSLWRLIGLLRWLFKAKASWGKMTRTASWQTE